jgi:iron-sulfur cluster repair protein YtfE (RIC family)
MNVSAPSSQETLLDQHSRLRSVLGALAAALVSAPEAGAAADWLRGLAAGFTELGVRLEAHFEHEERSGLFASIVEARPEALHTCVRLRAEHASFLERIGHLTGEAARGVPSGAMALGQMVVQAQSLIDDLQKHEETENALVSETLDGSVAAQD